MEPPIRILIVVKRSATAWREAWDEPQKTITRVLKHLGHNRLVSPDDVYNSSDCRFIAVERWDSRVYIACDLFNTNYNLRDAHLEGENELPVRVVYQRGHGNIITTTEPREIGQLGDQLRSIHDMHGWDEGPPYKIDHANGAYPVYPNPRSVVYR